MKRKIVFWIANIFIPLLIGGVVYILFRPDTYFSQYIFNKLNFIPVIDSEPTLIIKFIKYYLCDILWAYSLTFAVLFVFQNETNRFIASLSICIVFEMITEFVQLWNLIPGTFDFVDMVNECVTTLIIIFVCKKGRKL